MNANAPGNTPRRDKSCWSHDGVNRLATHREPIKPPTGGHSCQCIRLRRLPATVSRHYAADYLVVMLFHRRRCWCGFCRPLIELAVDLRVLDMEGAAA
jgi:hypothetical protein